MRKVGILGGTFDPPHLFHKTLAEAALEQFELDEVLWIPAFKNPLKGTNFTTPRQRLEMVKLATSGHDKFAYSDIEINRTGPSYMVETVEELSLIEPTTKWFLILGSDAMKRITEWKQAERLARMVKFVVAIRPPDRLGGLKAGLPITFSEQIEELTVKANTLSSTQIRSDIRIGSDPSLWLEDAVAEYIRENGLYASQTQEQVTQD